MEKRSFRSVACTWHWALSLMLSEAEAEQEVEMVYAVDAAVAGDAAWAIGGRWAADAGAVGPARSDVMSAPVHDLVACTERSASGSSLLFSSSEAAVPTL